MSKSRSLNKVMLIGNLTRSPVIRQTTSGVTVCSFGIATNTSWKDKSGSIKEKAEFHNLIAFNKLAEICATVLSISMLVYIEGELRTRVTEVDGRKQYRTEIKLNDMFILDSKGKKGVGVDEAIEAGESLPVRDLNEEDVDVASVSLKSDSEIHEDIVASDDEFKADELF